MSRDTMLSYRIGRWLWIAGLASALLWGVAVQAMARAPDDGVTWWTASPGGLSSGGAYQLHGAAGQPDSTTIPPGGGRYQVNGGFWQPAPNQAPVVDPLADQTGQVNDVVALQVVARDPEGGSLAYTAANLPPELQIDPATGLIGGRLAAAGLGVHTVTVTVTDVPRASAQVTFLFTVNEPTAIGLASFTGDCVNGVVVVRWTTSWELETFGFHLYRGETDDFVQAQRLTTTMIPGTGSGGGDYDFVDADVSLMAGRTFWYWLVEITTTGDTQRYGPIYVTLTSGAQPEWTSTIFLPMVAQ